ncbi:hypothetical protein [Pseudomonas fluorescens]|uniref:TauD/TfdA-like domain-containing protein n=1 Tax=Pseudomonas fluorescens TaxID=294 RepID=A0A5E7HSW2_PSEFL|nr:hypothetical protein [Pseudomonas fluorescens]VVO65417.1 hypothetical protein PS880_01025 [Pseudomonas fluorescens]
MTDAIKRNVENVELFTGQDIRIFSFDIRQSTWLHKFAEELAAIGGPQAPGANSKASLAATELKFSFSKDQCELLSEATPLDYPLTQESAMVINNVRSLHCRDVIKDNRRVLVRIFGLSKFSSPVVISEDPLLLQG